MQQSKVDIAETSVLAGAIRNNDLAQFAVRNLYNYPFSEKTKIVIWITIKSMIEQKKTVSPDEVLISVNDKLLQKYELKLNDIASLIVLLEKKHNINTFKRNVFRLINHIVGTKMSNNYFEYIEKLSKDADVKDIIQDNERLLVSIELPNDDEFVIEHSEAIENVIESFDKDIEESPDKIYLTGDEQIDKKMMISRRNVIFLAGKGGSFKTKFMIYIMRMLLTNYNDIAILWYLMEDPYDKAIRAFISPNVMLSENQMLRKGYDLSKKEKKKIKEELDKIKSYDIKYVNESKSIYEIGREFQRFREKRPNKFNILIIDNVMKIKEMLKRKGRSIIDVEEMITGEIDDWNIKTANDNACIFVLHHLNKSAVDEKKREQGYKPTEADMKGTSRFSDSATQVLFINSMGTHETLPDDYPFHPNIAWRMSIIHGAKNRNDSLFRLKYIAFPEFSTFMPVEKLLKLYRNEN